MWMLYEKRCMLSGISGIFWSFENFRNFLGGLGEKSSVFSRFPAVIVCGGITNARFSGDDVRYFPEFP